MKRGSRSVRVFYQNRLAETEKPRLYRALEAFANVGDSTEEFFKFGVDWPSFYPAPIGELEEVEIAKQGRLVTYRWIPQAAALFRAYRRLLNRVWERDRRSRSYVGVLLGTDHQFLKIAEEGGLGHGEPTDWFCSGWHELKTAYPDAQYGTMTPLAPSWSLGEFLYGPQNDFQTTLFGLFRESWRAKICSQCERYFIAGRPAQMYCSLSCTGEIKRRRNLDWWRKEGDRQRQEKLKKSHGKNN